MGRRVMGRRNDGVEGGGVMGWREEGGGAGRRREWGGGGKGWGIVAYIPFLLHKRRLRCWLFRLARLSSKLVKQDHTMERATNLTPFRLHTHTHTHTHTHAHTHEHTYIRAHMCTHTYT